MNTHVNPDKGVLRVAPDMHCEEVSVGANVTALAQGTGMVFAGLGDGRVVAVQNGEVETVARHEGAVTALGVDASQQPISAGQDGKVQLSGGDPIAESDHWITSFCQSPDKKRLAIAAGSRVDVMEDGHPIARLDDLPSTVSGIQFFADGRRIAISHYGGVSLWDIERFSEPERLVWAGSMISVGISPDDRFVASATQDREVHVWDLVTDRDFRLGGYQRKVKSFGWTTDVPYLYTTGADALVAWGLAGDPGAFPPKEIGYAFSQTVSAVAERANSTLLPAGFTDGSIVLGEAEKGNAKIVRAPDGAPVSQLIDTGGAFCFGTEGGKVGLFAPVVNTEAANSEID